MGHNTSQRIVRKKGTFKGDSPNGQRQPGENNVIEIRRKVIIKAFIYEVPLSARYLVKHLMNLFHLLFQQYCEADITMFF